MRGETDPELKWFSRTRITRREAIGLLAGGALTAAFAIYFISMPKPQVTTTATTRGVSGGGGRSGGGSSLMIHSVLATATIDTDLIPSRT
jgi:hypothetical protein